MNCDDCDSPIVISLSPWGSTSMAVLDCPQCGVSYDTNLDCEDIQAIQELSK